MNTHGGHKSPKRMFYAIFADRANKSVQQSGFSATTACPRQAAGSGQWLGCSVPRSRGGSRWSG
ncbi:MAG: hypothetical protein ACO1RT_13610, partial [Planctomycetaceae bacterium]